MFLRGQRGRLYVRTKNFRLVTALDSHTILGFTVNNFNNLYGGTEYLCT